jgi:signal transduction histidine kinase
VENASELQELRSRLVTSALDQRREIERALHDGAQQDLIGISVQLQLVRDLVATDPAQAAEMLEEVQREARGALDRLRALTAEIYPPSLESLGLSAALRQAAGRSTAAARVEAEGLRRYDAKIEAAVFFLWQSVLDGSEPNSEAVIVVQEADRTLQIEISAQGPVEAARARDLVEGGAGGVVTVADAPAGGISAEIPLSS